MLQTLIFLFVSTLLIQVIDPGVETAYEEIKELCYCNGEKARLVPILLYLLKLNYKKLPPMACMLLTIK